MICKREARKLDLLVPRSSQIILHHWPRNLGFLSTFYVFIFN